MSAARSGRDSDLLEVPVVAEYLDGTANRRVDRTVRSLCHRVGDVQCFEEQRGHLDGAARAGVEGGKL